MIAEAAPITAKKDEYTGDCSEDIAKFYEEEGQRQASILTDGARVVLSGSTAPYIEISHRRVWYELLSCDKGYNVVQYTR